MAKIADTATLALFAPDEALQPQLIPVEINLEGWPLFSRQKNPAQGAFEVRQTVSTNDGRRLDQLWRVTASHDFVLPGPYDEDVFVGVMALVRQRGGMPKDGKIRFSLYELIKILGKTKRGENYRKVKESLDRIGSTTYYTENAFYVVEDESLETYRFSLWTIHFSRAKSKHGRAAEHHTLTFDDIIIRSYNAGYLKLLDTDLYFALKIPLAKALYRMIDQRRRGSLSWSVDVRVLRDLLVMSTSYSAPSRIWEVLGPAHKALRRHKFLESATLDGNVARYRVHPDFAEDWFPEEQSTTTSLRDDAIQELIEHGVWATRARNLVERFGPEKAFHALELLKSRGEVGNKGAYVSQIIEHGDPGELADISRFLGAEPADSGSDHGKPDGQLELLSDPGDEGRFTPKSKAATSPDPDEDPGAAAVWEPVLRAAAEELASPTLEVWFEGAVPVCLEDHQLTLSVPNVIAKEYIESRFMDLLLRFLHQQFDQGAALNVQSRE